MSATALAEISEADAPFRPPLDVVLDLPTPPTLNKIWRTGNGRTYRSGEYTAWYKQADMAVMVDGGLRGRQPLAGPFEAVIVIDRKTTRADLDNVGTKALFDWAQARGFITNDKNCVAYTVRWATPGTKSLKRGCRLTIRPAEAAQ